VLVNRSIGWKSRNDVVIPKRGVGMLGFTAKMYVKLGEYRNAKNGNFSRCFSDSQHSYSPNFTYILAVNPSIPTPRLGITTSFLLFQSIDQHSSRLLVPPTTPTNVVTDKCVLFILPNYERPQMIFTSYFLFFFTCTLFLTRLPCKKRRTN
jgi:hypothetical protein